jgi:HSP90 family molecular chaperone
MVMAMMEQQGNTGQQNTADLNKNNTLEINPTHPIIVKLNELRKRDPKRASQIAGQLMDNILLSTGIPFNLHDSVARNFNVMNDYLNAVSVKKL